MSSPGAPNSRRRAAAFRYGVVERSPFLTAGVALLCCALCGELCRTWGVPWVSRQWVSLYTASPTAYPTPRQVLRLASLSWWLLGGSLLLSIALGVATTIALQSFLLVGRPHWFLSGTNNPLGSLKSNLSRASNNLRRLERLFATVALLLALVCGALLVLSALHELSLPPTWGFPPMQAGRILVAVLRLLLRWCWGMVACLLVLGVVHIYCARLVILHALVLSPTQERDERRQDEGNPRTRQEVRGFGSAPKQK